MYIPPSFRIDDPATLSAFMNSYSFATLVTCDDGVPFATHLPVRHYSENGECTTLVAHMARANPQWKQFSDDSEVLTIFSGPHAYISPSWYETDNSVPTWNYTATHVYGIPILMHDHDQIVAMLAETVSFYERAFSQPWHGILPNELRDRLIQSIVAFEIRVTRIEGKFKLGQNRSNADNASVAGQLANSSNPNDLELYEFIKSQGIFNQNTGQSNGG